MVLRLVVVPTRPLDRSRRLLACLLGLAATATACTPAASATSDAGTPSGVDDSARYHSEGEAAPEPTARASAAAAADKTLPPGVAHLRMTGCSQHDYFATVNVGGDTFSLLLDSGSTMLAVATSGCSDCGSADRYHTGHGHNTRVAVQSTYGDGSGWRGTVYTDDVAMGSAGTPVTSPVPVNFAAIAHASDFFTDGGCARAGDVKNDGILGLGPDTLLSKNATSLLTQLAATGTLAGDVFALRTCSIGGDIWFGGFDPAATRAPPRYTELTTDGQAGAYYGVNVAGMQVGGAALALPNAQLGPIVVDNGTSGLLLGESVYDAVVSALTRDRTFLQHFPADLFQGGTCPASARGYSPSQLDAVLPRLTFVFPEVGGGTFELALSATGSYLHPVRAEEGEVVYCPQMGPTTEGMPPLFGNAAMREHVVIFDRGAGRVGFAPQRGCSDALVSASVQ